VLSAPIKAFTRFRFCSSSGLTATLSDLQVTPIRKPRVDSTTGPAHATYSNGVTGHSEAPSMRASLVAVRFVAGNVIGWLAFMAVVQTHFGVPFWSVPFVFGLGITWAAQSLKLGIGTAVGFGVATVLGIAGSVFGLIGTQGMSGREPFFSVLLYMAPVLVVVNGVAACMGLSTSFNSQLGGRVWLYGVIGFTLGGLLAGLLATATFLWTSSPFPLIPVPRALVYVANLPFGLPMWLPSICGGVVVARKMSSPRLVDIDSGRSDRPSAAPS
jgi:hypothetical protein